ncbi:MAG: hypothetical protein IJP34_05640 [Clostridia bacterium]|nr:hypothetical protein [Clostridia bacterium]
MNEINFFAAANSFEGFYSEFEDIYKTDGYKLYIIKGGAGTGKSSFMKKIKALADEKNIPYILFPCSSDPNSLDGIALPSIKTAFADGTAPHILDPEYPAVKEEILNFGEFWESGKLEEKAEKIITVTNKNKALHKKASAYLKALYPIALNNLNIAKASVKYDNLNRYIALLIKKHIPPKKGSATETVRFLSGVTPVGVVSYSNTPLTLCKKRIIIKDRYGAVSDFIMEKVREKAISYGYNIIIVKNPFMPSTITDHIIIPELSLCFLREYEYINFDCPDRRIHAERFMEKSSLKENKNTLKFNRKLQKELINTAVDTLSEAKTVHDKLESFYIKAMDFKALDTFTKQFLKKLDIK